MDQYIKKNLHEYHSINVKAKLPTQKVQIKKLIFLFKFIIKLLHQKISVM